MASYREYVSAYPDGAHVRAALERKAELERDHAAFAAAEATGTAEGYQRYLKEYPKGVHAKEAKRRRGRLAAAAAEREAFARARSRDTVEAYEEYLTRYANGAHARQARERKAELESDDAAFVRAETQGTVEGYLEYVEARPQGRHAEEAKRRIERLRKEAADSAAFARTQDTVEAYEAYLTQYPNGIHSDEVRRRLARLIADHRAFDAARAADTPASYDAYLASYSDGRHADEAQRLRAAAVEREAIAVETRCVYEASGEGTDRAESRVDRRGRRRGGRGIHGADARGAAFMAGGQGPGPNRIPDARSGGRADAGREGVQGLPGVSRNGVRARGIVHHGHAIGRRDGGAGTPRDHPQPVRGGEVRGDVCRVGCLRTGWRLRGLPSGGSRLGLWAASGYRGGLGAGEGVHGVALAQDGQGVPAAERIGVGVRSARGATTDYGWGDEIGKARANCDGCGSRWDDEKTAPVGSFGTNEFGLYDVHGNVWEWVDDCWKETYDGVPSDGTAWQPPAYQTCAAHVIRGGSWNEWPSTLRLGLRSYDNLTWFSPRHDEIGFRVARTLAR